jgi:hypothetical protein
MVNIKHKTLEIVQACASVIIDQKMIERQAGGIQRYIRTMLPMQCENAVLTLVELFAADNIENHLFKAPLNWWEALKEATAPQMFLDRWPVKYRREVVDIKAIWQGYRPPPGCDKFGPFLPYVLVRNISDDLEDL